jgi:multiple sugar transport system ATP-binding protein
VRDVGACVVFAGYRLPIPVATVQARPGLERYFDRDLILGVRPSDFEDAALADSSWARIPVEVDVTEELGSEIHVIFTIDAPIVQHSSLSQAISDEDDDSAIALAGGKSQWTARVAARSKVRPGHRLDLALDTNNLHFFDPDSGLTIGNPAAA